MDAPPDNNTFVKPIKQCFVKNPRLMPMTRLMLTLLSGWAGNGGTIETTTGIIAKHIGRCRRQIFRYLKDAAEEGYLFYNRTKDRIGRYTGIRIWLNFPAIRFTSFRKAKNPGSAMNSNQAKKIDFPDLLSRLGLEPVKATKGGRELWYQSPFRKEQEPSFHTSFLGGKWIWKDFGDTGGNVIDFVMRYQGIQFKEALALLRNVYQGSLFDHPGRAGRSFRKSSDLIPFQQQSQPNSSAPEEQRELEFLEAHEIQNPVILTYLEEQRKIPADLARLYLKEVKYRNIPKNKTFFAFGMENESGGYEIRSASDQYKFKSALIKRDISVIRGRGPERKSVSVFEGMTDFLSLLVLQKTDRLEEDAVVMHSLSSFQRTADAIRELGYRHINTFLDNNNSGKKYTGKFIEEFPASTKDWSPHFEPHVDINDALKGSAFNNPRFSPSAPV